jgi:hypothetical protein
MIPRSAPKHPSPSRYSPNESKTQSQLGTISEIPQILPSRVHLRYKTAARHHVYGHRIYVMTLFPYTHMMEFRPGVPVQTNNLEAPVLLPTACSQYGVLSAWTLPRTHIHCQGGIRANNKTTSPLAAQDMTLPWVTNLVSHSQKPMVNPLHEHNSTLDYQEKGSEATEDDPLQQLTTIQTGTAAVFECNCLVMPLPRSQPKASQSVPRAP